MNRIFHEFTYNRKMTLIGEWGGRSDHNTHPSSKWMPDSERGSVCLLSNHPLRNCKLFWIVTAWGNAVSSNSSLRELSRLEIFFVYNRSIEMYNFNLSSQFRSLLYKKGVGDYEQFQYFILDFRLPNNQVPRYNTEQSGLNQIRQNKWARITKCDVVLIGRGYPYTSHHGWR